MVYSPQLPRTHRSFGIISLLGGLLGWIASFILFNEYTASLRDSNHVTNCDLSSTISCSQNFGSSFGSLFGFSNTVLGLSLFIVPIVIGILLIAEVYLPQWVRIGNVAGIFLAVLLTSYLQWVSFTQLSTLCIYCFMIWTAVILLFWKSIATIDSNSGFLSRPLSFIASNWWGLAVLHFLVILGIGELTIRAVSELLSVIFS